MHHKLEEKKPLFDKAVEHLREELLGIRTGRASSALVEGIRVDAYGSLQDMKNLASISVPDSQTVQIEPWDEGVVKAIEKAIADSDLNIAPNVAGKVIRLAVPALTEDTRKDMVKVVGKRTEEARIAVRNVREDIRKDIDTMEKSKEISEDERYKMQEELDKYVSDVNGKIEVLGKEKEEQIMTV